MGLLQISSRIGAAAAPWIAKGLKSFHKSVPFLVMGISSLIAAFLLLTLPETKGQRTAEVLERDQRVEVEMEDESRRNKERLLPLHDTKENCTEYNPPSP